MAKAEEVKVERDPDNRRTVILDRWPTEKEKTKALREKIRKERVAVRPTD